MLAAARRELLAFPKAARFEAAYALRAAELGGIHASAKPLKGYGNASVLEIVIDKGTGTYRVVYTVQFRGVTVLLHAFQKKSKRGIATPRSNLDVIDERLKVARRIFGELHEETNHCH